MAVNPDSATVGVYPMAGPPYIIRTTHVIAAAMGIVRPIADLNRDAAWVAIAWVAIAWVAIARVAITPIRTVPRIMGVIARSVPWVSAIFIVSASACTNPTSEGKEQENGPLLSGAHSVTGGDRLRVIYNLHCRIIIYGLDGPFRCLNPLT